MTADRRDQISDLYHRALERPAEDRRAFVTRACAGDEALREEVESLLRYEPGAESFLETPAGQVVAGAPPDSLLMANRQLGPYTIIAPLGAGGMGEVYRARDTKLGRDVAIKILPSQFTADSERRARFAREARLLATLNHPHIGAIYGLEDIDGVSALVLELVEGETLANRLQRGPVHLAQALAIARQIAEALDAAHEKGIVHRDLKPANIVLQGLLDRLSIDVRVKVLDFGLAKTIDGGPDNAATKAAAASFDGTADGRILGTPAYMSPEQARGLPVDKRTDVWAFGCVLFEMLTCHPAFQGDTATDTLARVLDHEPEWTALPAGTPPALRTLLERCLRKDPKRRLHDIADALIELEDSSSAPGSSIGGANDFTPLVARHRRRERFAWIVAAASLGIAAASVALLYQRGAPTMVGPFEFAIDPPERWYLGAGLGNQPPSPSFEISPDGQLIAAVALSQGVPGLWIRPVARPLWRPLPGTEGASGPFWSPDSQSLGFFSGGQLRTIRVGGGAPAVVADTSVVVRGAVPAGAWSRSGFIVFGGNGPLRKVRDTGGDSVPATTLVDGQNSHRWPAFLDDEHFVYLARTDADYELRVGSLTAGDIASLGPIESNGVYAAGHLLFVRGQRLMARPFHAASRHWTGDALVVAEETAVIGYLQRGQFSVSSTGVLAYSQVGTGVTSYQLTWMDRKGTKIGTVGEPGVYFNLDLSPDERHVAISRFREESGRPGAPFDIDIWLLDLARDGAVSRLTDDRAREFDPAWSHDGKWIAFNSIIREGGPSALLRRSSSRTGTDEPLVRAEGPLSMHDWSPGDSYLLYSEERASTGRGLWTVPATRSQQPSVFLDTKYNERAGAFSPDGRWIAYVSDESGKDRVYVRPFPLREGVSTISRDGGWAPRWRKDGLELFFLAPDGALMAAGISVVSGLFEATVPKRLFPTGLGTGIHHQPYAVAGDGQRFLIPVAVDPPAAAPINVVMDWRARLAKPKPEQ